MRDREREGSECNSILFSIVVIQKYDGYRGEVKRIVHAFLWFTYINSWYKSLKGHTVEVAWYIP